MPRRMFDFSGFGPLNRVKLLQSVAGIVSGVADWTMPQLCVSCNGGSGLRRMVGAAGFEPATYSV